MLAVANFHYIRRDFKTDYPSIFGLTPNQFRNQLKELSKHGRFVSQSDVLSGIPEDEKAILITFDDGLREQFELAKPILDDMKIPFICFVNTSNFSERKVSLVHKTHLLRSRISPEQLQEKIEKESTIILTEEEKERAVRHYNYDEEHIAKLKYLLNFRLGFKELQNVVNPLFWDNFNEAETAGNLYMDEDQLYELWQKGSLGSHGNEHDPLGVLSAEEVKSDLENSQQYFKTRFGEKARSFSYPYGSFEACRNLSQILEEAGFKIAFSMERAINRGTGENPFLLGRYDCNDLPGGKASIFQRKGLFETPDFSKWYRYENSSFNQQ